jgi:hypothetical protein
MVILILTWLTAALVFIGIDLCTRIPGEFCGPKSAIIEIFGIGLVAVAAFWLSH